MVISTEKKSVRIKRGQTNLIVHYNGRELVYLYPQVRSDFYTEVGRNILKQGLSFPTGDYTSPLLHTAYCNKEVKNEPEFVNIRELVRKNNLWVFNINLWTDKGVYVFQDLKSKGFRRGINLNKRRELNLNKLEKMLKGGKDFNGIRFSEDGRVRFAPKELYLLGDHTPETLAKDGFMIVSCGKDGAEQIGEVSSKFRYDPITLGADIQEEGQNPYSPRVHIGVSVIDVTFGNRRFRFNGDYEGGVVSVGTEPVF